MSRPINGFLPLWCGAESCGNRDVVGIHCNKIGNRNPGLASLLHLSRGKATSAPSPSQISSNPCAPNPTLARSDVETDGA